MRILRDQSKAEEVTQKIFIHAWMKLQSFRGESRFSSWLYRLSVNMILDQLKLKAPDGIDGPADDKNSGVDQRWRADNNRVIRVNRFHLG